MRLLARFKHHDAGKARTSLEKDLPALPATRNSDNIPFVVIGAPDGKSLEAGYKDNVKHSPSKLFRKTRSATTGLGQHKSFSSASIASQHHHHCQQPALPSDSLLGASLSGIPSSGSISRRVRRSHPTMPHDDEDNAEEIAPSSRQEMRSAPSHSFSRSVDNFGNIASASPPRPASRSGRILRAAGEKLVSVTSAQRPRTAQDTRRPDEESSSLASMGNSPYAASRTSLRLKWPASSPKVESTTHASTSKDAGRQSIASGDSQRRGRANSSASTARDMGAISSPSQSHAALPRIPADHGESSSSSYRIPTTPSSSLPSRAFSAFHISSRDHSSDIEEPSSPVIGQSKKPLRMLMRPSTTCSMHPIPLESCLDNLLPPPKGLATADMEARIKTICEYVIRRTLHESSALRSKSSVKLTFQGSSNHLPLETAELEETMQSLQEIFFASMQADIADHTNSLRYKDLRIADVFIEARRTLGLASSSRRLHEMFDIEPVLASEPYVSPLVSKADKTRIPSPPSAWDNVQRKHPPSLSPAPRRRRPKTAPNDPGTPVPRFGAREGDIGKMPSLELRRFGQAGENSSPSLGGWSRRSSASGTTGVMEETCRERHLQSQILTPATFNLRNGQSAAVSKVRPDSLPPTPPLSFESHRSIAISSVQTDSPLAYHQHADYALTNSEERRSSWSKQSASPPVLSEVLLA